MKHIGGAVITPTTGENVADSLLTKYMEHIGGAVITPTTGKKL